MDEPPTSSTRARADGARGARPRFVWTITPVALSTRRSEGASSRSSSTRASGRDVTGIAAAGDRLARFLERGPRSRERERAWCGREALVREQSVDRREVAEIHGFSV